MSSEERIDRSAVMPGPRVSPPGPGGATPRRGYRTALCRPVSCRRRSRSSVSCWTAAATRHDRPVDQRDRRPARRAPMSSPIGSPASSAVRCARNSVRPPRPALADRVHLAVAGEDVGQLVSSAERGASLLLCRPEPPCRSVKGKRGDEQHSRVPRARSVAPAVRRRRQPDDQRVEQNNPSAASRIGPRRSCGSVLR